MKNSDTFLDNLPKVDETHEIQEESLKALTALLPTQSFCLRDERVQDYGVDASLEIRRNHQATNFRAQVQLKGTRSLKPNKDGSYSLTGLSTSNLQYLLNAPIPIYILHLQQAR